MTEPLEKNIIDINKLENVRANGDGTWQAACPMCRADNRDNKGNHLRVYENMAFNCIKHKGDKEHNRGILTIAGTVGTVELPTKLVEPKLDIEQVFPESLLANLIRDFSYWEGRGLSSTTLAKYEGGVSIRGKMKNRYVFPIRDRAGRIHGATGRYIYPIKKEWDIERWKHLGCKENWIWDRENSLKAINHTGTAVLVEGPGCPLALREVGMEGVLPIFGIVPSSKLITTLMILNVKRLVVSLNNEPGSQIGNEAAERTIGILSNYFSQDKLLLRLPDRKDWLDCTMEQRYKFKTELYG